jgi:hypothetical protein
MELLGNVCINIHSFECHMSLDIVNTQLFGSNVMDIHFKGMYPVHCYCFLGPFHFIIASAVLILSSLAVSACDKDGFRSSPSLMFDVFYFSVLEMMYLPS